MTIVCYLTFAKIFFRYFQNIFQFFLEKIKFYSDKLKNNKILNIEYSENHYTLTLKQKINLAPTEVSDAKPIVIINSA